MLAGVFSLFATMGFVSLLMVPRRATVLSTSITILIYGVFAVGYALWSLLKKWIWIAVWAVLHFASFMVVGNLSHSDTYSGLVGGRAETIRDTNLLQRQMSLLGIGAITLLATGYVLFVLFIRREGNRFFRIQTEMELAREIHQSLVPAFARQAAKFEIFGMSVASGAVGGDLVDLAESSSGWIGYIADISGHGVSSGVLMAMFKTSIRSRLDNGGSPGELLKEVHRALFPLKMPNMFATAGIWQLGSGNRVTYSLAGHPPMLRYSSRENAVVEYPPQNMPIGIFSEQQFATTALECDPGDVLLLLTDGFTEVFNPQGAELGLEPIKLGFRNAANRPLKEIFEELRQISSKFGRQEDDQTILLARYLG